MSAPPPPNWNDAFDLSVYMEKRASSTRVASLAKQLRARDDVAAVRIITADEAMAEFREDSGFGKALDALGDNPLPDTLVVTPTLAASTPQGTDALKGAIAALSEVQTVQLDTEWVEASVCHAGHLAAGCAVDGQPFGRRSGTHRRQHHSFGYIEPARGNRGS